MESVEISLLPFRKEDTPPPGYDALISIDRIAIIEGELLSRIRNMARGSKEGLIKAAAYLEEQLGGSASRPTCLKTIKSMLAKDNITRNEFAVPLSHRYWINKKDLSIIENEPGISLIGKKGATTAAKQPRIETSIEWPNDIGFASNPDIDGDSMPALPTSMFKTAPKQVPMFGGARPPRTGGIQKIPRGRG